jgi:prepilin-type N-terminal cleavage/methylation domain-containing protein
LSSWLTRSRGLIIVGISSDDAPEQVKQFASQFKVSYPLLIGRDREDVFNAFRLKDGLPMSVFIRQDGRIARSLEGINTKAWFRNRSRRCSPNRPIGNLTGWDGRSARPFVERRESPPMRQDTESGFTLIELLIVVAIISIIAAIAVPGLLRSKMTANETSALASLLAINKASALRDLVRQRRVCRVDCRARHAASWHDRGVSSGDLTQTASPQKSGYNFTLGPGAGAGAGPNDCNGTATQTSYYATAVPQAFGSSGARSFATNAGQTVLAGQRGGRSDRAVWLPAVPIQ